MRRLLRPSHLAMSLVLAAAACGGGTTSEPSAASSGAERGGGAVRILPAMRPCEITQVTAPDADTECVMVERVQPESRPYGACNGYEGALRYDHDAAGRIVRSPAGEYHYSGNVATVRNADVLRSVEFDDALRIVQDGRSSYAYDAHGRLVRETSGTAVVRFTYAADETYSVDHNYPDTDEFCLAERVEVQHDEAGRAVLDRYDGCQINEPLRTLRYTYEGDRIVRVEIDTGSNGTTDRVLTLRYDCSDAP